jgi:hypothetical protein
MTTDSKFNNTDDVLAAKAIPVEELIKHIRHSVAAGESERSISLRLCLSCRVITRLLASTDAED